MEIDPLMIPTNRAGENKNIGVVDLSRIEIAGEDIDKLKMPDFKLPNTSVLERIPKPVVKILGGLVKFYPEVIREECRACGLCFRSCPAGAIEMEKIARIDHKKCILCLCCHEICPYRAIEVKRSYLARKLGI